VIATTGCLGGHVLQSLMNEGYDAALAKAGAAAGHLRP
jgi:DNA polymerase-3 subunit alpha